VRSSFVAGWALTIYLALFTISERAQAQSVEAQPLNLRADVSAHQLLRQMDAAFSDLAYDGVFSYLMGDDLASLRVVHKVIDGVRRERLVHLNGAPREIVRAGETVSFLVMPGDDLYGLGRSIDSGPFARAFVREFDRIDSTYRVTKTGHGRVAGRQAVKVEVRPKDHHRYGYKLWLDRDTALLLRSELVDHKGNKLEIFMFNQLKLGESVLDDALTPLQAHDTEVSLLTLKPPAVEQREAANARVSRTQWHPQWVPAGFKIASADDSRDDSLTRKSPAKRSLGLSLSRVMYSDGIATFSLYVEPMPASGAARLLSKNGATVALNHKVRGRSGPYLVTLVGEIPVQTAQNIVLSVSQRVISDAQGAPNE